ncbi:MAG: hypothetical protein IKZ14_06930 [Muribaculaceae bacterium]|nr:hypothetical protein [Muribaculaceae bacterium]
MSTKINTREVQLTLCEKCNLNCIYCYEHNKCTSEIDFTLAQEIIHSEFQYAQKNGIEVLIIYFHGGEICLCFDLLKQICEWIWNRNWPIKYYCCATTNGTLVHGEIKNWFKLNAHRFILALSLDGNKKMHDLNRCNSYDQIDIPFFLNTWPSQTVKMTISPQTIQYLSEGIIDIVKRGFKLTANLAYGCDWDNDQLKYIYAEELFKLSQFFIENPEIYPPQKLMQKWLNSIGSNVYFNRIETPTKGCGSGKHMVCYDKSGKKYPCQMFMPSSLQSKSYDKETINDKDIKFSKTCLECPILPICPTCIGSNYIQHGDLIKKEDSMCDYYYIEAMNYTYLLYNMLQDKSRYIHTRHMTEQSVALSLIAISHLQEKLQDSSANKFWSNIK